MRDTAQAREREREKERGRERERGGEEKAGPSEQAGGAHSNSREGKQRGKFMPGAEADLELGVSRVDHVQDAVHREGGLRDVGGHDALAGPALRSLEDLGLEV